VLQAMGAAPPYTGSRPLHIEEIDLAPPGAGEMLTRVAAAGLSLRPLRDGHMRRSLSA